MKLKKQRLQELAAINNPFVNEMDAMSQGDKMALQSAVSVLDPTTAGAIEDGYYALTDNLPNLINDLQKGIGKLDNPRAKKVMEKELSIYKQIEQLVNQSMLGAVL